MLVCREQQPPACVPELQFAPDLGRSERITPELKRDWAPTGRTFARLLAWLDDGVDSGGQSYLEIRRRLVRYFQRKRCLAPDDLADETLNRVARRLAEAGQIVDVPPARYCYIVAKFVLLEHIRQTDQHRAAEANAVDRTRDAATARGDVERREQLLECLDRCLGALEKDDAELILQYYRGEQRVKIEQRRRLAAERDLTANALSIRACRIRDKLEACINACRANRDRVTFRQFSSQGDE